MKHKQGKAGPAGPSTGADEGRREGSKGSIDREGQIKLGILIRRMYEADLQKPAPGNIADLVNQFDRAQDAKPEPADEGSQS
jgi:carbon monoxide dehydrogenase subunit G